MNEPSKLLLRKKDIIQWTGISSEEYEKLVESGVIVGKRFRQDGRLYFWKEHIRAKLIEPVRKVGGL